MMLACRTTAARCFASPNDPAAWVDKWHYCSCIPSALPKAQLRRWMGGIGLADSADLVLYHVGKLLVGVWCDVCP